MSIPQSFKKAIKFLFEAEGGTNTDPNDRGGLTVYGISEKQYPKIDLMNLTKEDAIDLYYFDYWLRNSCPEYSEMLAIAVFDSSVNCGASSAARWLQKSCNAQGSKLVVDGIAGKKTIKAVHEFSESLLVMNILAHRLKRYATLVNKKPSQIKFICGWIKRVSNLMFYLT